MPHGDTLPFFINSHIKPSELHCTFFVGAGGWVLLGNKIVFPRGYATLWTGPRQQHQGRGGGNGNRDGAHFGIWPRSAGKLNGRQFVVLFPEMSESHPLPFPPT